ncbi:MAG: hypothetical protein K9J46_05965, partial [Saprospiraceae bacterium]|nr:hypothetical protein [Saprospiraceae bacterium]
MAPFVLPKSASAAQTLPSCLKQSIGNDMSSQLGDVRFAQCTHLKETYSVGNGYGSKPRQR